MSENSKKVIELDKERMDAMAAKDVARLKALIADDLVYTHTNGKKDNNYSRVSAMLSCATAYRQFDVRMTDTRDFGDAVILIGEADMMVSSFGQRAAFEVRFTAVYARHNDNWQMAVWQSTKAS